MSDEHLRGMARRAAETGSFVDSAWLELGQDRVGIPRSSPARTAIMGDLAKIILAERERRFVARPCMVEPGCREGLGLNVFDLVCEIGIDFDITAKLGADRLSVVWIGSGNPRGHATYRYRGCWFHFNQLIHFVLPQRGQGPGSAPTRHHRFGIITAIETFSMDRE